MDKFISLGLLLDRASVSLATSLNRSLLEANIDLPHSQFVVLRCLYYNDGISQQKIAELLSKDAAAIKRTIDNLEKKGYVKREVKRPQKNQILISEIGKAIMPKVLQIAEAVTQEALRDIDIEAYHQLSDMLTAIYENINK